MLTFLDFSLFGNTDSQGDIEVRTDVEALFTALTQWVTSGRNEYIRNPGIGGLFMDLLDKTIDEDRADEFRNRFLQGLKDQFRPAITVVDLAVSPNYDDDSYQVFLSGYVPEMKRTFIYRQDFRSLSNANP